MLGSGLGFKSRSNSRCTKSDKGPRRTEGHDRLPEHLVEEHFIQSIIYKTFNEDFFYTNVLMI